MWGCYICEPYGGWAVNIQNVAENASVARLLEKRRFMTWISRCALHWSVHFIRLFVIVLMLNVTNARGDCVWVHQQYSQLRLTYQVGFFPCLFRTCSAIRRLCPSTRSQTSKSPSSSYFTIAPSKPAGTGWFCSPPSTLPWRSPTTCASSATMTTWLVARPSVILQWRSSSSSVGYSFAEMCSNSLLYLFFFFFFVQTLFLISAPHMSASRAKWFLMLGRSAFITWPRGSSLTWWPRCPLTCSMPSKSAWWVNIYIEHRPWPPALYNVTEGRICLRGRGLSITAWNRRLEMQFIKSHKTCCSSRLWQNN